MKKLILTLTTAIFFLASYSQNEENTLMTIDDNNITSDEFIRVFQKNNNITAETEQKSVDDYLDLFVNYKLKVIEAEDLGFDTVKSFIDEFEGYKKQLAKPYLHNQEVKERLIKEAYERNKYELEASHILIKCPGDATPEDTLKAYNKASEILARLKAGEPFEEVAKAESGDPSAKDNGGLLGYFTAFRMVYPFEIGAYNTPIGQISNPVRSDYGYHLIKIHHKIPNRGSINVAHIMVRLNKEASGPEAVAAEEKIEKAYKELKAGADWNEVVQKYSENPRTREKNGEIGWLQTGQAPNDFMTPCFELEAGQYTKPIKTTGGYHIGRVIEKKVFGSFEENLDAITRKVDNNKDFKNLLKDRVNLDLKNKFGFSINPEKVYALEEVLDSGIYVRKWDANKAKNLTEVILTIGGQEFTQYDYAKYLSKQVLLKGQSYKQGLLKNLDAFSDDCVLNYTMEQLPNEHSDYKYLLNEYHDGILLFNLTNDVVWKRAQEDSAGLENFHKKGKKYNWNERLDVAIYVYEDSTFSASLPKLAKKHVKKNLGNDFLTSNLCPNDTVSCISSSKKTFEKGEDAMADKLPWKKGASEIIKNEGKTYLYYIIATHPVEPKKLNEARGLYIADYQEELEKEWIIKLREKHVINIDTAEFERLKKELN